VRVLVVLLRAYAQWGLERTKPTPAGTKENGPHGQYCVSVYLKINMHCILHQKPEMKSTATSCMPEVASDLSYDFKKMI